MEQPFPLNIQQQQLNKVKSLGLRIQEWLLTSCLQE
ncbi:hypothetical protein EVA_17816 [gut metagenome]|uniref:Uncharacterized protein n=1 Tax=gut metagenome TaxID=749906 RepID=J9G3H8_9ZZZZ